MVVAGHQVMLVITFSCFLLLLAQRAFTSEQSPFCHPQTYTIAPVGNDSRECVDKDAQSRIPCGSLEYLLTHIHGRNCVNVVISHDQSLSRLIVLQDIQNWTITGNKSIPVSIHCKDESGLSFENANHLHLDNLVFVECSALNNQTGDDYPLMEYSGLYFLHGSNVEITRCGFHDGSGTGVIMNNVAGKNLVRDSNFTGNRMVQNSAIVNLTSGGLIVRRQYPPGSSSYVLAGCSFVENVNSASHWDGDTHIIGIGGGVTFNLSLPTSITVTNCNFANNEAWEGGGLHVYQAGGPSSVNVTVANSNFTQNSANRGGGMLLQQGRAFGSSLNLTLLNTSFSGNGGTYQGGLGVYHGYTKGNMFLVATNSSWIRNSASTSGFAVGLFAHPISREKPSNVSDFHLEASFSHCKFKGNRGKNFSQSAAGAVKLAGSKAEFADTLFFQNMGTALLIRSSSYVTFSGSTVFDRNHGNSGGALYVDKSSLVGLREGDLRFQQNHATRDGGAIYVEYSKQEYDKECVFESLSELLSDSSKNISVFFYNNTAGSLNQSIFVGNAEACLSRNSNGSVSMQDIILFDNKIFTYFPDNKTQVASFAKTINLTNVGVIEVMPGESFGLFPAVKDTFGNDAYQYGNLALVPKVQSAAYVELVGPRFFNLDSFTHNSKLSIKSAKSMIHKGGLYLEFLYTQKDSYHDGSAEVRIELVDCELGFAFNESRQICQCNKSENLLCQSSQRHHTCIRYGYWYGNYTEALSTALPCPGRNCEYQDGNCPKSSGKCPGSPGFCQLESVNSLCWSGRSGLLCSECQSEYSYTFAGLNCAPNKTCRDRNTALFVLALLVYWIMLVAFMLIILNIDLSVGSGIVYGLMYYFSVVQVFTDNTVTDSFLQTLINSCVAVTQLTPQGFGDIMVCFIRSWRLMLQHQLFYYVTPIAVIFLIVVVIYASRCCRCPKSISPAQNTPIHAMCLLILASYTSVTFTSFKILRPIYIEGELRVFLDPKLEYFGKEHVLYALVALFFEIFVSLPVCFFILLAPCLSKKVNMVKLKLKPILDEFQACYRPECRWFAGFYFLARQLIFLVNAIPFNMLPEDNMYLHTINAGIFIFFCSVQPYKLKWLNILDALLLADLIFLSFIHLEYVSDYKQRAIGYFLILLPALYLVIIITWAVLKRSSYCFQRVRVCRQVMSRLSRKGNQELRSALSHTSVQISENGDGGDPGLHGNFNDFFSDCPEREPLLADCDESDHVPPSSSSREDRRKAFTTTSLRLPSSADQTHLENKASTN